jgi:hypothetical protein
MKNESANEFDISKLSEKMKYLDEVLKKDLFNNPVREVHEKMRNDLLGFRESFFRNLYELETYVV